MKEASGTANNSNTFVSLKRLMTDKDDGDDDGIGADSENNDRLDYKRSKLMKSQSPSTMDEFLLELLQHNNDDSTTKIELKMSLDAIFYPKFENELPDQKIRQQMLTGISTQKGYLEISLKHSG
jgi:hypothetical protein